MASPEEKPTATASDLICKFSPTEFTSHLDSKQKERYVSKLTSLNISDPYCVPQALFTPLMSSDILPDLQYPDIYNYLIDFPSMFTGASLKAYKSLEGYQYFTGGLVQNCLMWHLRNKDLHIAISKVRHLICSAQFTYLGAEKGTFCVH